MYRKILLGRWFSTPNRPPTIGMMFEERVKLDQKVNQIYRQLFGTQNSVQFLRNIHVGALFSRLIGNSLPGAIYISQDFNFSRRVLVGEQLLVRIAVTKIVQNKRRATLKTQVISQLQKECIVSGKALILYSGG